MPQHDDAPRSLGNWLTPLDEANGPARPLSPAARDALVESVLARHEHFPALTPRRSNARRYWLLAAALLLTAAAAATVLRRHTHSSERSRTHAAHPPVVASAPVDVAPAAPHEMTPSESAPASSTAPTVAPASEHATRTAPEDLLETANRLRGARRWREADRAYRRVVTEFPATTPAYTASVAAAQLELEQLHAPRAALALYRQALHLRPAGDLSEEAAFGIAEANRLVGDRDAETAALRTFLQRFPASLDRARAERRLNELEATAP